jgi:hypothetical protein
MSRFAIVASVSALLIAGCASTNPPATKPAPAPTPAITTIQPAPSIAKVRTARDIGMAEILDDPKKLAVLKKYAPAVANHPQIAMARSMTLADVASYSEAGLSPTLLKSIVDDINKL